MLHGILWTPLLFIFLWLAWAGWNEYQKVEAYRLWAEPFDNAKYDIYAVLGIKGKDITWGKPSRTAPINLQTFSLDRVRSIELSVNQQPVDLDQPPTQGKAIALEFQLQDGDLTIAIPFTDLDLAIQWGQFLRSKLDRSGLREK